MVEAKDNERYADLPAETRAFFRTLGSKGVVDMSNMLHAYAELNRVKKEGNAEITPLEFLLNANPRTLAWLKGARPYEIDRLDEAIKLVESSRTVGRFVKWTVITCITVFGAVAFAGDWIITHLAPLFRNKGGS